MDDGTVLPLPFDEFMERASNIAVTWLDLKPIAEALQAEYQRGLAEGAKDGTDAYERGRADMRAEILATLTGSVVVKNQSGDKIELTRDGATITVGPVVITALDPDVVRGLAPKTPTSEEMDEIAEKIAPPDSLIVEPGFGGGASVNARPFGIPSTFQMFQIILREMPDKLTSRELVAEVARRWWPGLKFERLGPDISSSVTRGRIHRDLDGRLRLTEKGDKVDATDNRGMAKQGTQPPQPKQAALPQPRGGPGTRLFVCERRDPIPLLNAEWAVADTLYRAMGKGFVDVTFLATKVWGSARGGDTQAKIALLIDTLNPKLDEIGLKAEYHRGFGYIMKDTTP